MNDGTKKRLAEIKDAIDEIPLLFEAVNVDSDDLPKGVQNYIFLLDLVEKQQVEIKRLNKILHFGGGESTSNKCTYIKKNIEEETTRSGKS